MASGQVLIVSADERWLRVLEVTIRLGGADTISRHSVAEALRTPPVEGQHPTALVVDFGAQTTDEELEEVGRLVHDNTLPAVVILPERLAAERERFVAVGAAVLIRPYRPSELFAALWPGERANLPVDGSDDKPLTVDAGPEAEAESSGESLPPSAPDASDASAAADATVAEGRSDQGET